MGEMEIRRREIELRTRYIEEIVALEAQISDGAGAEIALQRSRADAAGKRAATLEAERDQLRQQVEKLEHDLAECYRLTGSDPDGDPDPMLAKHAVQAVGELREEADKAGEREERAVSAESHRSTLLQRIHAVKIGGLKPGHPQSARSQLFNAADQVRKELGE
jgi:cell division protein FtsB